MREGISGPNRVKSAQSADDNEVMTAPAAPAAKALGRSESGRTRLLGLWLPQLGGSVLLLAIVPLAAKQLAGTADLVPALIAFVACLDLLCLGLLLLQFRDTGDRRAWALSWAYATSLTLLAGYAAAFPGVLGQVPPLGANPSTAPWLWAAWHFAFPVLLAVAAAPWPARWNSAVPTTRRARWAWATTTACVAAGSAIVAVVVLLDRSWPVLIVGADFSGLRRVVGPVLVPVVIASAVVAIVGAWRSGSGMQRAAALAATAAMGDVVLSLSATYRFSTAWYAGRTLTLVSSAVVLVALLAEFSGMKQRLAAESERLAALLSRTDDLQRLHRTLLDHMTDGVLMHDRSGRLVATNPAAVQLIGLSVEQLSGDAAPHLDWRLLSADGSPLDPIDLIGPATRTLRTGIPERGHVMGVQSSAEPARWLSLSTAAARDGDGGVDYVISSVTDVTERHADELAAARDHRQARDRIQSVLERQALTVVFQPIVELATGRVVGAEALSRFPDLPSRTPDVWFAEASRVGLGAELELMAIVIAISSMDALPAGSYLSLNAAPDTVVRPEFAVTLHGVCPERIVLELTEHASVEDYADLERSLRVLRNSGIRLAVDDAGAGFASLRHILNLRPDIVKLDVAITRGLHTDPARRALAAALLTFGHEIGSSIVAEGVESWGEFEALRTLGVAHGQGFALGRPGPLPLLSHVPVPHLSH